MGYVSAGAYAKEIDLSLYAETEVPTVFAQIGVFNRGPLDTPTLVVNEDDLLKKFGKPIDSDTWSQQWLALREFFRRGNKAYVVRVDAPSSNAADYSEMSLPSTSDDTLATANDGATSAVGVRTLTSAGAGFIVAGVLIGDVLEVADISTPGDNGFYVLSNVAATVLTVDRDWPTGSLTNLIYTVWSAKKEEGSDGATSIVTTRKLTSVLSTFTTNGVVAGDILKIRDGVDTGDNGLYRIVTVAATYVIVDRDFPIGSLTNLDFTIYSNSSRANDGSTAVSGTFSSASSHFALHGVKAGDVLVICDAVDTGNNGTYLIKTASDTSVTVNEPTWIGGVLAGLTFYVLPGGVKLTGSTKGTWCKGYNLWPQVNSGHSTDFDILTYESTGTGLLDNVYNMTRSTVVADMLASSTLFTATLITGRGEPCPGFGCINSALSIYLTLSGGVDGYTSITDSDYITGINLFKNPDTYTIDLIACSGVVTENVQNALANLAEKRQDCLALIDGPDYSTIGTVQAVLNYHNGVGGTVMGSTARSSSYCAFWWTWQKVYDEYNDVERWIAPSGHMAADFAYVDSKAYPWFTAAGLKRGRLIGSSDVRYSPDQDDRDALQSSGQAVNPIISIVGDGIYVYGNKTLYRGTTALNRISNRRLLNYLKRGVRNVARYLVFDPNDAVMWRELKTKADPIFEYAKTNRGISEYKIIADSTTTTATEIEQYKMVGKFFIKTLNPAEVIELDFVITSQGTNFSENIVTA
jgi:hypothetical protein